MSLVRRAASHASNVAGFALVPALSFLSALAILPLVAARFGAEGWTAISVGQALGAFGGVFVGMAWPVVGPFSITRASSVRRRLVFWDSICSRGAVFVVSLPLLVLAVMLTVRQDLISAVLTSVATMTNGFTFAWFYAAVGRPYLLVRNEAVVRLLGQAAAILALAAGLPLAVYGGVMIVAGIASIWLSALVLAKGPPPPRTFSWRRLSLLLRKQWSGTLSRGVVASGMYLSPLVVGAISGLSLASYSALDQLRRISVNVSAVLPQSLTRWVGEPERYSPGALRRVRKAFIGGSLLGCVVWILWMVIGPGAIRYLFAGQLHATPLEVALLGAAIAGITVSQFYTLVVFAPLGIQAHAYLITAAGSIGTLLLVALGAAHSGLVGALLGQAVGSVAQSAFLGGAFLSLTWKSRVRVPGHERVVTSER